MKQYEMKWQCTIEYETHLICLNIFIPSSLYQTNLQTYIRLLDTRWHEGSSKAKRHEAMAFERWIYVGYCSLIYREGEQLHEKLQTCPWSLHTCITNDAGMLMTFPFLSCYTSFELHIFGIFMSKVSSVPKLVALVHTSSFARFSWNFSLHRFGFLLSISRPKTSFVRR
jgi:hypothetical protein